MEWESFIKDKKWIYLNFSDFKENFEFSSNKLFDYLKLDNINKSPKTNKLIIYKNPFTEEKQNKIYKFRIRLLNKLISFLSNLSPTLAKKFRIKSRVPPSKKLNLEINEDDILDLKKKYNEAVKIYHRDFNH